MRQFSISPLEMISSLWRNRELICASAKREVLGRYRGSFLGLIWSFVTPLLMLTVYTFVFSVVFGARWGAGGTGSRVEYAMLLFAGLLVFNLFSECITRAPNLVVTNPSYVKKIIYPLEVLPAVGLLAAFYHSVVSLGIWLFAYVLLVGIPHLTVLYFPLIIFPFALFVMGLSLLLSSLGVFLRDVSQFVGVITSVLMFASAVFYPISALPDEYQNLLRFNPLVPAIEMVREVLYWGQGPDPFLLAVYWVFAAFVAWLGFAWFQKTRKGFADVL